MTDLTAPPRPPRFAGREHWIAQTRFDTPLGPLTAVATARGLAGLWFDDQAHHPGPIGAATDDRWPLFAPLRQQMAAYWHDAAAPFTLALDPQGTAFQQRVWQALLAIPTGQTTTYGGMAEALGQPGASRAVGAAVGRNPIGIIVPCHRVIGRDGSLTGYAGGLHRKTALLQLEGVLERPLL